MARWHHQLRCMWVWVNSGSWWWTGRPGVLQSVESQRVRHDRATELNWAELKLITWCLQFLVGFLNEWWELEGIYKEYFLVFTTLQSFAVVSFIPNLTTIYIVLKITLMSLSVKFSHLVVSNSLRPHEPQHARPPCPSTTPGVHPNPCPLSRWCHPTIPPLSSSSPPALNLSQHQGLFKWVSSLHQVAKVLEFQLQHQSFQWTPRTDLL